MVKHRILIISKTLNISPSLLQYLNTLMIKINQTNKINHLVLYMKPEFPILQLFCHCVLPGVSLYTPQHAEIEENGNWCTATSDVYNMQVCQCTKQTWLSSIRLKEHQVSWVTDWYLLKYKICSWALTSVLQR